jgi:hypothetical protein
MKQLILALALLVAGPAVAGTDYVCVNQCTMKGFQYGLCTARCTYPDSASLAVQPSRQTDFACVNQCTRTGLLYGLCLQRCSY